MSVELSLEDVLQKWISEMSLIFKSKNGQKQFPWLDSHHLISIVQLTETALLTVSSLHTGWCTNTDSSNSLILFPFLAHQDECPLLQNMSICAMWILAAPKAIPSSGRTNPSQTLLTKCSSSDRPSGLLWSFPAYQYLSCAVNPRTGKKCSLMSADKKGMITDQLAVLLFKTTPDVASFHFFRTHCWPSLSLLSPGTPKYFNAEMSPRHQVPNCRNIVYVPLFLLIITMFPGPFCLSGSLWMAVLYQLHFQTVSSHKSDDGAFCLLLHPLHKQELKRIGATIDYQGTPFVTSPSSLYPLNLIQAAFYSSGWFKPDARRLWEPMTKTFRNLR